MLKTPPPAPTVVPTPALPIENVRMYIEMAVTAGQQKLVQALGDLVEEAQRALRNAQKGDMPTNLGTFANLVATTQREAGMWEISRVVKTLAG